MSHSQFKPEEYFELALATAIAPAVHQMYKENPVTSQLSMTEILVMHTALYVHSIVLLLGGLPYEKVEEIYNERMKFIRTLAS